MSEDSDADGELPQAGESNPVEYRVFKELLLFHCTNNYLIKYRKHHPEIVQRVETLLASTESGKIIRYIQENPVFVVPVLRALEGSKKSTAYHVVRELMELGIVKRWPHKADHPTPGTRGPKPHIHSLVDVDLNGADDPRILEAQKAYHETHERFDPVHIQNKSIEKRLNKIGTAVMDYFRDRGRIGLQRPDKREILPYIRQHYPDLPGPQIADIAEKAWLNLYKEGHP